MHLPPPQPQKTQFLLLYFSSQLVSPLSQKRRCYTLPHLPTIVLSSKTEMLPKSQWYNSFMFLTITPSSHLLQGHVTILQNFLLSHPARKQLPSQSYMVKPSLHLSGPHDQSSPMEMLVMCVSSRPRAPRNGWASSFHSCSLLPIQRNLRSQDIGATN